MKTDPMKISSMTSATCTRAVERFDGKLVGNNLVSVNLATEKMNIHYESCLVMISEIQQVVVKARHQPHEIDCSN